MFIQSSRFNSTAQPFIITFCLIHVVTSLNPPSITSTSPQSIINHYTTATRQYGHLQVIPLSFFLISSHQKSRCLYPKSYFLLLILLSGDIHLNPGPTSQFNICTLNIRSLTNQLHFTALADLALTHHINFLLNTLSSRILPPGRHQFLQTIREGKIVEEALLFWFNGIKLSQLFWYQSVNSRDNITPMTESKPFCQVIYRIISMERTSESQDLVETECLGNERLFL